MKTNAVVPVALSTAPTTGTTATAVSKRINQPFIIKSLSLHDSGADAAIQIRLYISNDPTAPTVSGDSGSNLLSPLGANDYLLTTGTERHFNLMIEVPDSGKYLKLQVVNGSAGTSTVEAVFSIELLGRGEKA